MLFHAALICSLGSAALAVFAILLTAGLPALSTLSDSDIPPDKFFGMFAKGLLLKPKLLYVRYAELCGLMLKHAAIERAASNRITANDAIVLLLPAVVTNLQAALVRKPAAKNERGTGRFLDCLQILALHYPPIVDSQFFSKV